jgi:hypothetical protein
MSNYSDLSDDAETWKANFVANIGDIEGNYSSDVDAFARSLAAKIPDADELGPTEGRAELEEQLEDDPAGLAQLQRIFDDYEENSEIPETDEIKRLIIARADGVSLEDGDDLDDTLMDALDEFATDWQNNWSSSFGF